MRIIKYIFLTVCSFYVVLQIPLVQEKLFRVLTTDTATIKTAVTGIFPFQCAVEKVEMCYGGYCVSGNDINIRLLPFAGNEKIRVSAKSLKITPPKDEKKTILLPPLYDISQTLFQAVETKWLPSVAIKKLIYDDLAFADIKLQKNDGETSLLFQFMGKAQHVKVKGKHLLYDLHHENFKIALSCKADGPKLAITMLSELPHGLINMSGDILKDNSLDVNFSGFDYAGKMIVQNKEDHIVGQLQGKHLKHKNKKFDCHFKNQGDVIYVNGEVNILSIFGKANASYNLTKSILQGSLDIKVTDLDQLTRGYVSGEASAVLHNGHFNFEEKSGDGKLEITTKDLSVNGYEIDTGNLTVIGEGDRIGVVCEIKGNEPVPLSLTLKSHYSKDTIYISNFDCNIAKKTSTLHDIKILLGKQNTFSGKLFGAPFTVSKFDMSNEGELQSCEFVCEKLPLSVADIYFPDTAFYGFLSMKAEFTKDEKWKLFVNGKKLSWSDLREENQHFFKPLNLDLIYSNNGFHELSLKLTDHKRNTITGSLKPNDLGDQLDYVLNGQIDMSIIHALLPSDDRLAGRLNIDLNGSVAQDNVRVKGDISLSKGFYENALVGTQYKNIEMKALANGESIKIEKLTAQDIHGTRMHGEGAITFQGLTPHVLLNLHLKNCQIATSDMFKGKATGTVGFKGELADPTIFGEVDLMETSLFLDDVDDDIVTLHRYGEPEELEDQTEEGGLKYDILLNTKDFSIHNKTIQSKWQGSIKLLGTTDKHYFIGKVEIIEGKAEILGKECSFMPKSFVEYKDERHGMPWLNLVLKDELNQSVNIYILVRNYADQMKINFRSDPPMKETDVLSYFLFGKNSGEISAFEGVELATTLSAAQSSGGGLSFLGDLKKSLGVDLGFEQVEGADGATSEAVSISKRLKGGLKVGVRGGSRHGTRSINLSKSILPNVTLDADFGENSGVGISWVKRY